MLHVLPGGSPEDLDVIEALADAGQLDEAARRLRDRLILTQDQPGDHAREAHLAERLGLGAAAVRAWQLALRDHPDDRAAWEALAVLHEERGDLRRAAACRAHLGQEPAPPEPPPAEAPDPGVSEADVQRFAALFAGRQGVHARMWHDPRRGTGYSPVHEPLSAAVARAHLEGRLTAGAYLVRVGDRTGHLVLDLDVDSAALDRAAGDAEGTRALRERVHAEGLRLRDALRGLGLDPLLVDSGYKGRHLWLRLDPPAPASAARAAGLRLAAWLAVGSPLHLEVFPKQDRVPPGGLGNLVKLPLGLHLRSRRWCALLDDAGEVVPHPLERLRAWRPSDLGRTTALPAVAPAAPPAEPAAPPTPAPLVELPWTEADFELSPQVAPVLLGCGVLRALVEETLSGVAPSRDASVVLNHSLGHLPDGVRAVNYLYDRFPDFPVTQRMHARHRGSPVSCKRIRQRLPRHGALPACRCSFPEVPGKYPNPLRHLEGALPDAPTAPTLDELLGRYTRQLERARRLDEELATLRGALVRSLQAIPGGRWPVDGGEWRLEDDEGLPVLRWVPA